MYELTFKKSALKALRKMPQRDSQRLQAALKEIAKDPDHYMGDWKPLKGEPLWRLRQGSYRAICSVDDGKLVLLVLKVGPRGDVYK